MTIYNIVKYPDPILFKKVDEVKEIDEFERKLAKDLIETMHANSGVGLAANQVAISSRMFVVAPRGTEGDSYVFINPVIIRKSGKKRAEEGCLSVPECYAYVTRHKRITVRALDLDGKTIEVEAENLFARIIQHELDHLDGIVFVQRLGLVKRKLVISRLNRRAKKRKKEEEQSK
jgi:peptide deformylase